MFNENLAEKLIGREVTILHKSSFKDSFDEFFGLVKDVEPRVVSLEYFNIPYQKNCTGGFLFGGMSQAVYQIKNSQGKVVYQNDSVPKEYSDGKFVSQESSREKIRDKGIFFN